MKLITWLVALCNKRWQREFDTMKEQLHEGESEIVCGYDVNNTEILDNQPTHLSRKFRARAKRKHSNKESQAKVSKQEALQKIMDEEFARMAEGR